jgi:sec-independent protein translocase protein TatA
MFGLEPWHIVLLLGVILVVFGPKRLPEIGKSLGASISEFRKATSELPASVRSGAAAPDAAPPSADSAPPAVASIATPAPAPQPGEGPSGAG